MLKIDIHNNIYLTRGDTANLDLRINSIDGSVYELGYGDVVKFTVKKTTRDKNFIFQKVGNSYDLKLEPSDTENLEYGSYVYDVQLTMANGDVFTIIPPATFEVMEEVTW